MTKVQTLEQFCIEHGYPTWHDVDGHIHAGLRSKPTTKTYDRWYQKTMKDLQDRRSAGVEAYVKAKEDGLVREPNRIELLKAAARGHPDNASTHAARNVLKKYGIEWE